MGLLSKIKSMLGFGAKTTAPTQKDARKQGQFKGKKKPFEKKNKRNKGAHSTSRHTHHQSTEGDVSNGPVRSRSAKPNKGSHSQNRNDSQRRNAQGHQKDRRNEHRNRNKGNERPPRIDHNLRNTPSMHERPGGAFTPEQLKAYADAHASWDPASYVVPEAEGKKRFVDFGLPGEILHAVADLEFQYCTPIQAQSLEYSLEGKNVTGRAQTGTGKTAAFLIAVLTRYLRTPEKRNLKPGTPRALILAPTRELVIQICKDAEALGKYCGDVRSLAIYGGMDYDRQRRELEDAPVDILVATPGRLIDFVRNHILDLRQVDTLVIDEADRMLDMGFIPDVRAIVNRLPDRDHRCTMLYSATLNETVMNLAAMWMRDPVRVEVESETMTTETIRQIVYIARSEEKFKLLFNHLKKYSDARTIIFCNRKFTTERICENLRRRGIPCEMLSGDVNQMRRLKILEAFRAGDVRTVVATDVAGRGIHVDDIAFVVNYDFPYEPEDYVHRIGRTGRAGHTGTAISFADEDESFIIPEIEEYIKEPLKCVMPEEWMYEEIPSPEPRKKRDEKRTRGTNDVSEEATASAPTEVPTEAVTASSTESSATAEMPVVEAAPEAPEVSTTSEPAKEVATEETTSVDVDVETVASIDQKVDISEPASQAETSPVVEDETPPQAIVVAPSHELVVKTPEEVVVQSSLTRYEDVIAGSETQAVEVAKEAPAEEPSTAESTENEETHEEAETVIQPVVNKPRVARPVNRHQRRGNAVVARPQHAKAANHTVTRVEVREEREPRNKVVHKHQHAQQQPFTTPAQRKQTQKNRPPRSNKPVAKRWARTQAENVDHRATNGTAQRSPIYVPGARGPIADEWTPGN